MKVSLAALRFDGYLFDRNADLLRHGRPDVHIFFIRLDTDDQRVPSATVTPIPLRLILPPS